LSSEANLQEVFLSANSKMDPIIYLRPTSSILDNESAMQECEECNIKVFIFVYQQHFDEHFNVLRDLN